MRAVVCLLAVLFLAAASYAGDVDPGGVAIAGRVEGVRGGRCETWFVTSVSRAMRPTPAVDED